MEDVKNHMNFEFVCKDTSFQKVVNKPNYSRHFILNENIAGVQCSKSKVKLNKPIAVGVAILSLSKHHMYNFYYNTLKKKYQDNISLLYTDTDSFVIDVKTKDIYDDFKKHLKMILIFQVIILIISLMMLQMIRC